MCNAYKLDRHTNRYKHKMKTLTKNSQYRLYWEYAIPTDLKLSANRPDLLLVDDSSKQAWIIDISVPCDNNVHKKIAEKKTKYYNLGRELLRLWSLTHVEVVPIVVGALGGMSATAREELKKIQGGSTTTVQQEALQGTLKILRTLLNL